MRKRRRAPQTRPQPPSDEATLDHGVIMQMPLREFVWRAVRQLARPLAMKRREQYVAKWRRRMGRKPLPQRTGHYWWEQDYYGTRKTRAAQDERTNGQWRSDGG